MAGKLLFWIGEIQSCFLDPFDGVSLAPQDTEEMRHSGSTLSLYLPFRPMEESGLWLGKLAIPSEGERRASEPKG